MIRPFQIPDFDSITHLWRRAREAAVPELVARMGYSFEMDRRHFKEHVIPSCQLWVVEQEKQPVAFMGIKDDFIDYLYVDPDYHRQGLGRALIEHARRLSPNHLWLFTHVANMMARAFYEKNGFVAVKFGVSPAPELEPDVEYHWSSVVE